MKPTISLKRLSCMLTSPPKMLKLARASLTLAHALLTLTALALQSMIGALRAGYTLLRQKGAQSTAS